MVKIEINGVAIEARDGAMVIEAADEAGITIPRFCYHKKLSIAANCRMCLVEVEKVAKPLPACATPVTEGMRVYTHSARAVAAQRGVMEFLLINHPLDCPICDQGGECDLQEMAMGFGQDVSRYTERKRVQKDKNIGPLIATDMTRCIHCTRCVRFGQEVAGMMELGAPGRGEHMYISTFVEDQVDSELSGNVIDLCPVGALTSKPYRYTSRPWELRTHASVSPHDCVGANLHVQLRGGRVMRTLPGENEDVNEVWLADRDRFSYTALQSPERLLTPRVKANGSWQEVDWDTALHHVADRIKSVCEHHGAQSVGALSSHNATTEEQFLLQKLVRGIGSGNVDHRLHRQDFRDQAEQPVYPSLGMSLKELDELDTAFFIGANLHKDQPLIGHRVRRCALDGGQVMLLNPEAYTCRFPTAASIVAGPQHMVAALAGVAVELVKLTGGEMPEGLEAAAESGETHAAIARSLLEGKDGAVFLGSGALVHPAAAELVSLAGLIARLAGCRLGALPEGGNSAGASLAGALPHRGAGGVAAGVSGMHWREMVEKGLKACILHGIEPVADCADAVGLTRMLGDSEFCVALTPFISADLESSADVLLPVAMFPETSGTLVNAEGRWQSFAGCAKAPGEVRPAWKVLRVLGNLLDVDGFDYLSSEEVLRDVRRAAENVEAEWSPSWLPPVRSGAAEGLVRVGGWSIYGVDGMVRRSEPLQATTDARRAGAIRLNPETAKQLGLTQGEQVRVMQGDAEWVSFVFLDSALPPDHVGAANGLTDGLPPVPGFPRVSVSSLAD